MATNNFFFASLCKTQPLILDNVFVLLNTNSDAYQIFKFP